MTVDPHLSLAHGAVKKEGHSLAGSGFKLGAIPAGANVRQTARAPRLERCFGLAVLRHGHRLEVVAAVKRARNRPVVRHSHLLPPTVVVTGSHCSRIVCMGETPAVGE